MLFTFAQLGVDKIALFPYVSHYRGISVKILVSAGHTLLFRFGIVHRGNVYINWYESVIQGSGNYMFAFQHIRAELKQFITETASYLIHSQT